MLGEIIYEAKGKVTGLRVLKVKRSRRSGANGTIC